MLFIFIGQIAVVVHIYNCLKVTTFKDVVGSVKKELYIYYICNIYIYICNIYIYVIYIYIYVIYIYIYICNIYIYI